MSRRASVVVCVVFGVLSQGCNFGSGLICKVKGVSSGQLEQCLDATQSQPKPTEVTLFETACRAAQHELTSDPCPTENRVGGCRGASGNADGFSIAWYYATADVKTLQDVRKKCSADQTLVDPMGAVINVNNGVCSMKSSTTITTVTFKNGSDAGVTMYLRDDACAETEKGTLDPGAIRGFPTFPGESWTARQGTSDTNGVIRLEFVVPSSSAGLVTIN